MREVAGVRDWTTRAVYRTDPVSCVGFSVLRYVVVVGFFGGVFLFKDNLSGLRRKGRKRGNGNGNGGERERKREGLGYCPFLHE